MNQHGIIDILRDRLVETPDATAFLELSRRGDEIGTLSFESLYRAACAVAVHIQEHSDEQSNVLLLMPQSLAFIAVFYGCLLSRRVAVPCKLPRPTDTTRLVSILKCARVQLIVTVRQQEPILRKILNEVGISISVIFHEDMTDNAASNFKYSNIFAHDRAVIQFTSGTTKVPRGVVINHGALAHNSQIIKESFQFHGGETVVSWLPFTHDMGLIGHIIQPVFSGFRNVFMSPIAFVSSPIVWLRAISRYGGVCSGAPNFAYRLCCDKIADESMSSLDLSPWRLAYCGAERIEPSTARAFISKFESVGFSADSFFPCYGLAESTLYVSGRHGLKVGHLDANQSSYVSVGTPSQYGMDVNVVEPDSFQPCRERSVGEILFRSLSNATGFYTDTGYSEAGALELPESLKGFIRSGDLGYINDGELYVVGRIKDVIKIRGQAVAAEDIEVELSAGARSFGLDIYAVVATSASKVSGEIVVALIETSILDIDTAKYEEKLRQMVCDATGVLLDDIVFVSRNALPRTSSGKVKRSECATVYALNKVTRTVHDDDINDPS